MYTTTAASTTYVHLASKQPVKVASAADVFGKVFPHDAKSRVSEQPVGIDEIKLGAYNRLESIGVLLPAVAFETGLVKRESQWYDTTVCVLKTELGVFETAVNFVIPDKYKDAINKWQDLDRPSEVTLGSIINPAASSEWYDRRSYMTDALKKAAARYYALLGSMPISVLPADVHSFKGVKFLDLQYPLTRYPQELTSTVRKLADGLLFNKIIVLDARGFLLASEFMKEGFPVIMARKAGKLPDDIEILSTDYEKEYGTDTICIEASTLSKGDVVLVIDDVIATGGTMAAVEKLVNTAGATVVGFIAPYAITIDVSAELNASGVKCLAGWGGNDLPREIIDYDGPRLATRRLLCSNALVISKCRFLCDQVEAEHAANLVKEMEAGKSTTLASITTVPTVPVDLKFPPTKHLPWMHHSFYYGETRVILPPSLKHYDTDGTSVDVRWGKYARSPNIWFDANQIKGFEIIVAMDPSNSEETLSILQLLSILHRHDPKKVTVVIPFLEQATQDRVEFKQGLQSLACVDTIAKLLGEFKVVTYDLHAEQSRFAFHDLRFTSLVAKLLADYRAEHPNAVYVFPDDGSYKRYGKMAPGKTMVYRKVRNADSRIVHTDDTLEPGATCVVIDDLVRSGGTMNAVAKHLKSLGAGEVDALFAHAPFEAAAAKNMGIFKEVWTTDTCSLNVPRGWVKRHVYFDIKNAKWC